MAITLNTVPEQVTVTELRGLLDALGIEINDLRSLQLAPREPREQGGSRYAFVAVICARDEHGKKFVVDGELATHTIVIPVVADAT